MNVPIPLFSSALRDFGLRSSKAKKNEKSTVNDELANCMNFRLLQDLGDTVEAALKLKPLSIKLKPAAAKNDLLFAIAVPVTPNPNQKFAVPNAFKDSKSLCVDDLLCLGLPVLTT